MKFWLDTEFHENGQTIDLISIGIVAEDGREYYAVNADCDWFRILKHDWLMANVVPYLPTVQPPTGWLALDVTHSDVKPKSQIAVEVREFLQAHSSTPTELWAWFGAYDHVALAQLFGRMIDLPNGIPMWTNDVRQLQHQLDPSGRQLVLPTQDAKEHHALADSRHTKRMYEYLAGILESRTLA